MNRLLLRPKEAAEVLGIGRSNLYQLLADGSLDSVKLGGLRRVSVEALQEFVERLRKGDSLAGNRVVECRVEGMTDHDVAEPSVLPQ